MRKKKKLRAIYRAGRKVFQDPKFKSNVEEIKLGVKGKRKKYKRTKVDKTLGKLKHRLDRDLGYK